MMMIIHLTSPGILKQSKSKCDLERTQALTDTLIKVFSDSSLHYRTQESPTSSVSHLNQHSVILCKLFPDRTACGTKDATAHFPVGP